ncbi:MAG: 16S rRNA (guanine(527)-N(7))-methyltransferase RsmG [Bacillota bacterium]|jgi:16S rRNA (guanine527-N7)-methyltransferase
MFIEELKKQAGLMGIDLNAEQAQLMEKHWHMVMETNSKFNLTAITDSKEALIKHYLDSLLILPQIAAGSRCLDVGSGAGFPGVPAAIMQPASSWILLDSLQKRCGFLWQVKKELGLSNVEVLCSRAEVAAYQDNLREKFDVVVARAVSPLPSLLECSLPFVAGGGYFLAMKGPSVEEEIAASQQALSLLGGRIDDLKQLMLPDKEELRSLVVVKKISDCPGKYPRRAGKPQKHPL